MNDCGAVPIKLYLQKDRPSQIWPTDPDLKSRFAVSHDSVCWWEVLLVLPVLTFHCRQRQSTGGPAGAGGTKVTSFTCLGPWCWLPAWTFSPHSLGHLVRAFLCSDCSILEGQRQKPQGHLRPGLQSLHHFSTFCRSQQVPRLGQIQGVGNETPPLGSRGSCPILSLLFFSLSQSEQDTVAVTSLPSR